MYSHGHFCGCLERCIAPEAGTGRFVATVSGAEIKLSVNTGIPDAGAFIHSSVKGRQLDL